MKKTQLIFLFSVLLLSCEQTELQYSCDPIINTYVTQNLEELSLQSVSEISVYDIELQRAIFNSWTAEKKRSAWLDKLNFVLDNESFTETEANHLQNLIDHIYPGYFVEEITQQEDESRSQFAAGWISFSFENLGWSNEFIAFIAYRLYVSYSQMEAEISMINILRDEVSTDSESFRCDCFMGFDLCWNARCTATGCSDTPSGCGFLLNKPCDGNCVSI